MNYAIDVQYKLEVLKEMIVNKDEPKYINSRCNRLLYNADFIYGHENKECSEFIKKINNNAITSLHIYCTVYGYKSPKERLLKRYVK